MHWNYHAMLMVAVWFVLVPICIVTIRFGKPKPTLNGIREKVALRNLVWWWFSVHKYGLMLAVGLALGGAAVALTVSGGLSGYYGAAAAYNPYYGVAARGYGYYNAYTGFYGRGGAYYNPYTGNVGAYRAAYNPYTGGFAVRGFRR